MAGGRLGRQPFAELVEVEWSELAHELGEYDERHVWRVGNGDVAASEELREDLAAYFGRPIEELLNEAGLGAVYQRTTDPDSVKGMEKVPKGMRGSARLGEEGVA